MESLSTVSKKEIVRKEGSREVRRQVDFYNLDVIIKKMRARDPELSSRWGTICTPTRMMASDGKYYNIQAAPQLLT